MNKQVIARRTEKKTKCEKERKSQGERYRKIVIVKEKGRTLVWEGKEGRKEERKNEKVLEGDL